MCSFSKPSAPPVPEPERITMRELDEESSLAKMDEKRRLKSSSNSATNVLTSGTGLSSQEAVKKPTMLGE